ncbi:MAG: hypothetical protein OEV68_15410, partial [candidate division Zixibacteria bacterium]|nr:hypothetical protein [candidate division Zixibacteria bacterium]
SVAPNEISIEGQGMILANGGEGGQGIENAGSGGSGGGGLICLVGGVTSNVRPGVNVQCESPCLEDYAQGQVVVGTFGELALPRDCDGCNSGVPLVPSLSVWSFVTLILVLSILAIMFMRRRCVIG